jgi:hypothetical protein
MRPPAPSGGPAPEGGATPPADTGAPTAPAQPGTGAGGDTTGSGAGAYGDAFAAGAFGAGAGNTVAANDGYIDSAIIRSRLRVRYESAYDLNAPDKAEFFYAKCGCFGNPLNFGMPVAGNPRTVIFNAPNALKMGYDPRARGPQHGRHVLAGRNNGINQFSGDPRIDYQEQATYLEYAPLRNFSTFIEMPVRFLNPTLVSNANGFSDINMGFKYAFVADPNAYYTFQFRTYVPTGAADKGLGTGHTSLEPALLVFQRLTDRIYFSGEFRDWIPVQGSNFAGNILRYGIGLTYNIVLTEHFRVAPVNEVVGWTILGGKEVVPVANPPFAMVHSVAGQTIVNEKIGIRFGLGNYSQPGGGSALNDRHSFYVGYGQVLTGDHWYKEIFRMEYNYWF